MNKVILINNFIKNKNNFFFLDFDHGVLALLDP